MPQDRVSKKYFQIASQVLNKPLYVTPQYAHSMFSMLAPKLNFSGVEFADDDLEDMHGIALDSALAADELKRIEHSPHDRYLQERSEFTEWWIEPDGTAVVPVFGSLTHKSPMFSSLGRSYQSMINDMSAAHSHEDTRRVAMLIDSNGGHVSGCRNCAEELKKIIAASDKETWAFADESMFSAAMWVGSTATRIVLPKTGENGSVGVVWAHASYEKALAEDGVKITLFHAGAKKVQGNSYNDLSKEDIEDFDREINKFGEIFFESAAENLGLSVDVVRDAEADTFMGEDAVDIGFAHAVMEKADFFAEFAEYNKDTTISIPAGTQQREGTMPDDVKELSARLDKLAEENEQLRQDAAKKEKEANDKIEAAKAETKALKESQDRRNTVMEMAVGANLESEAKEMLGNELFAAFPAEAIIDQLNKMAATKVEDDEDDEDDDDEEEESEELNDDAKALLNAARKNAKGNSKKVANRGEGAGKSETKVAKGKYSETYDKNDREAMMADQSRSNAIVRANRTLARKSI